MKRIAVTGSAGFIGSHLVDALLKRDYDVIGIDNLSMGFRRNFEHHLGKANFTFHEVDVVDYERLSAVCRGVDTIVHLAAFKIPRYGKAIDTLLINNKGSESVFEVARRQGSKVVLGSTSDVYGRNPQVPFSERSESVFGASTVPRWAYAVSKLFDEHLAFAYSDAYQLPVVVLRFFGCYGPRHHLTWWGGPQSVFIDAVLNDREIEIHGDGEQTRSFTFIDDMITGIVAAIEKEEAVGEVLNLGSTREITILGLARLIKEVSQTPGELKLRFVEYSSFSKKDYEDVRRRVPDVRKAESLLGVTCPTPLEEGLVPTIAWQREQTAAGR